MSQNLKISLSETYDLHTQENKMGCVAVHTPAILSVSRKYPGLLRNFTFISFDRCDIVMACASALPLDPLQVGTEAGQVAPQDAFNPFLHRAVSNDSFNTIRNRMLTIAGDSGVEYGNPSVIDKTDTLFSGTGDEHATYYGLLGLNGWKKALPQEGIVVKGLYPIAYQVLDTYGGVPYGPVNTQIAGADTKLPDILESDTLVGTTGTSSGAEFVSSVRSPGIVKGKPVKMPRWPLHASASDANQNAGNPPVTYVWMMCTPPASSAGQSWYYRIRITWHITLHKLQSAMNFAPAAVIRQFGSATYANDFVSGAKETTNTLDAFEGTDIEQVM